MIVLAMWADGQIHRTGGVAAGGEPLSLSTLTEEMQRGEVELLLILGR